MEEEEGNEEMDKENSRRSYEEAGKWEEDEKFNRKKNRNGKREEYYDIREKNYIT